MRDHICFIGAALLGASLVPPAAPAATGNSTERANEVLQEVVVTATRREERVRDVPQAVSVLTGDQLQAIGLSTAEDYSSFLPGLSFNRAGFADRTGDSFSPSSSPFSSARARPAARKSYIVNRK